MFLSFKQFKINYLEFREAFNKIRAFSDNNDYNKWKL